MTIGTTCKICLEDTNTNSNKLISPCSCSGTIKYVHRNCINYWRNINLGRPPYTKCMDCNTDYIIYHTKPIENYQFSISFWNCLTPTFSYFAYHLYAFFLSVVLQITDKNLDFLSEKVFSYKIQTLLHPFIKSYSIIASLYYFSLLLFLIFIIFYASLLLTLLLKVKRKLEYFKYTGGYLILQIFFVSQFYSGIILFSLFGKSGIETYLVLSSVKSYYNLHLFIKYLNFHNKIINKLNNKNIGELKDLNEID